MLFACSVVIQTAFLAFTLLLTLLGLNYSHEPLTGSNLASVLIVGMFAAMTWHFQFRPLNMMIQRKMILLDDFHLPWHSSPARSEEHTSELQSLMRISYAVFCLKKKKTI